MSVTQRYTTWLEFVEQLVEHPTPSFPRHQVRSFLVETFDTRVSWNWLTPDGAFGFELSHPIPGWPSAEAYECWSTVGRQVHPLLCWFDRTGDPRPMSIGRVPRQMVPPGGFELTSEWSSAVGVDQELSIPYRLGPDGHCAFVLLQGGKDYSAEDLDLARRIQPLLALVGLQSAALQRTQHSRASTLGLTSRETLVLQLLSEGHTAHGIARRLGVSPRTVHGHLNRLYRKLGVSDRLQAVLVAQDARLLRAGTPAAARAQSAEAFVSADGSEAPHQPPTAR